MNNIKLPQNISFNAKEFERYIDLLSKEDRLEALKIVFFKQSKVADVKLVNAIVDYVANTTENQLNSSEYGC